MKIAYISQGKLFLRSDSKKKELIESEFGQRIVDTAHKINKKHEWKAKDPGAQFMGGGPWSNNLLTDIENMRIHISAVCKGLKENEILYSLDTDDIGGLFKYDTESGSESGAKLSSSHAPAEGKKEKRAEFA